MLKYIKTLIRKTTLTGTNRFVSFFFFFFAMNVLFNNKYMSISKLFFL